MLVVVNPGVFWFTTTPLIFYAFNRAHTPTTDNRPQVLTPQFKKYAFG